MDDPLSLRDLRQRDVLPPERLAECRVSVIGIGAVGRQVALQLAAIGVHHLQLVDFDCVEPVNLAAQGYLERDLGRMKTAATAELCRQINSTVQVDVVESRFRRSQAFGNVVFACVDSIDVRRRIFEAVWNGSGLFIDGRMAAEALRVLAVADDPTARHYADSLFSADQAFAQSCTARSTIFCANICAGLMVSQFARWLRGMPVEPDIMLNLLAGEWTAMPVPSSR